MTVIFDKININDSSGERYGIICMPENDQHSFKKEFFTTGEVAEYFSVTADAVRKWLRSGKLSTEMTPGGHHRIPRISLLTFIRSRQEKQEAPPKKKLFQYCWEFHGSSEGLQDGCRQCVVYRSRTGRCFELAKLPAETGHAKLYCTNTCEECEYYEMIRGMDPKLLIVTNRPESKKELESQVEGCDFTVRFTATPYSCSRVIESYYPDFIIVDCSHGPECSRDFIKDISEDFRIPLTRIILAGNPELFPKECDKMVFAFIVAPFTMKDLADLTEGR